MIGKFLKNIMGPSQSNQSSAGADLEKLYNQFEELLASEDFKAARTLLDQIVAQAQTQIAKNPNDFDAHYWRGRVWFKAEQYDKAGDDFSTCLTLNPKNAQPWYWRGCCYEKSEMLIEAGHHYTKAIQLDPNHAKARFNRGVLSIETDAALLALADLSEAAKISPELAPDANYNLGLAYFKLDSPQEALTHFQLALNLGVQPFKCLYNMALIHMTTDRSRAIELFSSAIDADPENPDAYFNRGYCFVEEGQFNLGLPDFKKVISLQPDTGGAYYWSGVCLKELGQDDEAISDWQQAAEMGIDEAKVQLQKKLAT